MASGFWISMGKWTSEVAIKGRVDFGGDREKGGEGILALRQSRKVAVRVQAGLYIAEDEWRK